MLCSWVFFLTVLTWQKSDAKLRHFTIRFPRKSENQLLGLTSKWPTHSDHEGHNKLFLLIFLIIGPLSQLFTWYKTAMLGSQGGALWDKTNKELTSYKVVISYICRPVIKRRGPGIFPGRYERGPRLLSQENRRKIGPKEIFSCNIPCLFVAFTQQLEILVTCLVCLLPMRVLGCLPFTRTYHSVHGLCKW